MVHCRIGNCIYHPHSMEKGISQKPLHEHTMTKHKMKVEVDEPRCCSEIGSSCFGITNCINSELRWCLCALLCVSNRSLQQRSETIRVHRLLHPNKISPTACKTFRIGLFARLRADGRWLTLPNCPSCWQIFGTSTLASKTHVCQGLVQEGRRHWRQPLNFYIVPRYLQPFLSEACIFLHYSRDMYTKQLNWTDLLRTCLGYNARTCLLRLEKAAL